MVTSRRQIEKEEDRYGAFVDDVSPVETAREFNDELFTVRTSAPRRQEVEEYVEPATERVRETYREPVNTEAEETTERVREMPRRRVQGDLMQRILPRERVASAPEEEVVAAPEKRRLPSKVKFAVAVYASVVLAIVIGIIATGIAVSGVNSDISTYESRIESQQELLLEQAGELAALSDSAALTQKASDLGMVKIAEGEKFGFEQLGIEENTDDASGIFDSVRDWLNGIFGG